MPSKIAEYFKGPNLQNVSLNPFFEPLSQNFIHDRANMIRDSLNHRELKSLFKSWKKLKEAHDERPVLRAFEHLFQTHPETIALFGMRGVPIDVALNDHVLRRHALVLQEHIGKLSAGEYVQSPDKFAPETKAVLNTFPLKNFRQF